MTQELKRGKHRKTKMRYMPGLDGLRAIAVLGIIIYHLNRRWLTGGFIGVDTFFVISGYLITSLLLKEYEEKGIINLRQFWIRRIKRLLPAVVTLLMVVGIATLIFEPQQIVRVKHDILAALFYVSNWWYIAKDVNYFEQFSFMPLKHLWSLAIEEQFYLFFPFVLVILLLTIKKYRNVTLIFWIISLVSLLAMVIISQPNIGYSRVYFGTDTRLQTLLLGVILAFIWPPFKLKANPPVVLQRAIDGIGIIGLITLILLFFTVSDSSAWIYNGGFYLISGMTLFVIASVVHPTSLLAKLIGNPVFVYIGQRSYSLYLWHFAVISFIHIHFIDGQIPAYVYIVDIILTVLFAELSYRYVETPFRKEGFKAFSFNRLQRPKFIRTIVAIVVALPLLLIFVGVFDRFGKDEIDNKANSFNTEEVDKYLVRMMPGENIHLDGSTSESKTKDQVDTNISPLLIGDSVMVDIGETFKSRAPKATIDGKVGRHLQEALTIASNYSNYNKPSDQVVLELGTNGDFSEDELNQLISKFGDAQIYLVNTRVPRDWQDDVNKHLANATKKHKNVTLVDWYKRSEGHSEYFASDGIHLENSGVRALSDEIIKTIKNNKKNK
ncbi:acetyltransferase [Staphylococcus devriesei]|uniref:Acetyltransferase n=1 Tax=Staphylococcus devriesei TaxID=586733 RepID=A0A2K4DNT5_9STAP|nr:acyltransferase family protein [Staphylococcus devriesei]MCE5096457.1 acetyltransferase [Staphylococcus devriesei]PNZ88486.1 acyltransferase [Staphylococcus devriesei]PTE73644.1 acetyltransferase [Staphylococcus devriesei]PTF13023.1 acetyltransferase [Staphylococcus devriesei]PTF18395.1 acetyltransferase [Staphylococcus devriesei]